jgi:hypothetical protein
MSAAAIQELNQFASSESMVAAPDASDRQLDHLARMHLIGTAAWSRGKH